VGEQAGASRQAGKKTSWQAGSSQQQQATASGIKQRRAAAGSSKQQQAAASSSKQQHVAASSRGQRQAVAGGELRQAAARRVGKLVQRAFSNNETIKIRATYMYCFIVFVCTMSSRNHCLLCHGDIWKIG